MVDDKIIYDYESQVVNYHYLCTRNEKDNYHTFMPLPMCCRSDDSSTSATNLHPRP